MSRILIIDDEESMRFVIRGMLNLEGFSTDEAIDGAMGLERCKQSPPDLVITDLVMPEKEGIETIMELRKLHPDMKIIAISGGAGFDPTAFLAAARELGADDALSKPFKSEELIAAVRRLLES